MEAAVNLEGSTISNALDTLASNHIGAWCKIVDDFYAWERSKILLGDPTPDEEKLHNKILKDLVKWSRIVSLFPPSNRELSDEITWRVERLESSERLFFNTMSEAEADAILKEVFPG